MRALADKVALQGFIVVMPDLASGTGPGGGNFDSFQYSDDLAKALGNRSAADKIQLVRTARDYALKLPRANGKSGVTGFCNGGGMAWESTAAIAGLNADGVRAIAICPGRRSRSPPRGQRKGDRRLVPRTDSAACAWRRRTWRRR